MTASPIPPSVTTCLDAAVAQALTVGVDDEAYWDAVYALQRTPMDVAWPLVAPLASDANASLRVLAADVLRGVLHREPSLVEPTMSLLALRLQVETEGVVLAAVLGALGELRQPTRVQLALPFARHADPQVREATVHALGGARSLEAIEALIRASADEVASVRDWATFELGSQLGDDDNPSRDDVPGVVEALLDRLDDTHVDTRCEAIVGLARRGDRRVLPALHRAIEEKVESSLVLEAAALLGVRGAG